MKTATASAAISSSLKNGDANDVSNTFVLPIAAIEVNDNPRHEPSNLYGEGYVLIGKHPDFNPEEWEDGIEPLSLSEMALSKDIDDVREFVELIEKFETVNRSKFLDAPESIVELSESLRQWASNNSSGIGQFIPTYVKKDAGKWNLIDGGRRTTATLYLHAKDRIAKADGAKDAPSKPYPAVILCMDATGIDQDKSFELSMMLNMARKQLDALQEGLVYSNLLNMTNPKTNRKYNLKELHARYGSLLSVKYNTMRNRVSLWAERTPEVKDEHGNVIKKARGLTDADRAKVASGEMTATAASRKSLGENHKSSRPSPEKGQARRRSLPLSEIENEFDRTDRSAKGSDEFLRGLAFCMGITPKQAIKESDKRIKDAEDAELAAE